MIATRSNRGQTFLVFFPQHKGVVPVFVDPAIDSLFEQFEIEDPANFVLFRTGYVDFHRVVVSMQITALAFVTDQSMAGAKGESPHDTECHWWVGLALFKRLKQNTELLARQNPNMIGSNRDAPFSHLLLSHLLEHPRGIASGLDEWRRQREIQPA